MYNKLINVLIKKIKYNFIPEKVRWRCSQFYKMFIILVNSCLQKQGEYIFIKIKKLEAIF